jgi:lipoyl(octanoyl) transferase
MTTAMPTQAPGPARVDALEPSVRHLGIAEYETTWRAMQSFTGGRSPGTRDAIWVLQHPPVYTLGVAGRSAHLPRSPNAIPVIKIDRGGQITYHGPGQIVVYLLLDLRRRGIGVRMLVRRMEQAVIDLLQEYAIAARGSIEAPGVYVGVAKIAALGLRIRNGCCYHGLALNVDMDLTPFHVIDACGYPGLAVTQMRDLGVPTSVEAIGERLVKHLLRVLQ